MSLALTSKVPLNNPQKARPLLIKFGKPNTPVSIIDTLAYFSSSGNISWIGFDIENKIESFDTNFTISDITHLGADAPIKNLLY
jgi:hypothetical protein